MNQHEEQNKQRLLFLEMNFTQCSVHPLSQTEIWPYTCTYLSIYAHLFFSYLLRLEQIYVGSLTMLSMKCVFARHSWAPSIPTHATTMARATG